MSRKIVAQGDYDGACFLYSIVNSYTALTGKKIRPEKWMKCIRSNSFKTEEFLAGGGTKLLDGSKSSLEGLCREFINIILPDAFTVRGAKIGSAMAMRKHLSKAQVIIAPISECNRFDSTEDGYHWVSVVDSCDEGFNVACSATALENLDVYYEEKSSRWARFYNKTIGYQEPGSRDIYGIIVAKSSES